MRMIMAGALALGTLFNIAAVQTASAQSFCDDYARNMVRLDRDARGQRCPGWNSHSNYDHHRGWCVQGNDARGALARWTQRFNACPRPGAARAPLGPVNSNVRCDDYATRMVNMDNVARRNSCAGWTSHADFNNHRNWCMARPPADMQRALSTWTQRFRAC